MTGAERQNPKPAARGIRPILAEGSVVAICGLLLALAANGLSPRGLALGRNYFPGAERPATPASTNAAHTAAATNQPTSSISVADRLKARGLQVADSNLAVRLFKDPKYKQELIIFVDSREDKYYQEGHVPGAYQFDHYHPADYLAAVLSACQTAECVLVYCNGGSCEDSEFAAITLRDTGVPAQKLQVYPGGMAEWLTNGLPVEIGARNSGVLKEASK